MLFGYHNHDFEFSENRRQTIHDIIMENTDPKLGDSPAGYRQPV